MKRQARIKISEAVRPYNRLVISCPWLPIECLAVQNALDKDGAARTLMDVASEKA